MRITLSHLEALLAEECEKIDELQLFGSVSPDVYAVLYLASRQGFIESADVLFATRHCSKMIAFLLEHVLTADDVLAVEALSMLLWFNRDRTEADGRLVYAMQSWDIGQNYLPKLESSESRGLFMSFFPIRATFLDFMFSVWKDPIEACGDRSDELKTVHILLYVAHKQGTINLVKTLFLCWKNPAIMSVIFHELSCIDDIPAFEKVISHVEALRQIELENEPVNMLYIYLSCLQLRREAYEKYRTTPLFKARLRRRLAMEVISNA